MKNEFFSGRSKTGSLIELETTKSSSADHHKRSKNPLLEDLDTGFSYKTKELVNINRVFQPPIPFPNMTKESSAYGEDELSLVKGLNNKAESLIPLKNHGLYEFLVLSGSLFPAVFSALLCISFVSVGAMIMSFLLSFSFSGLFF